MFERRADYQFFLEFRRPGEARPLGKVPVHVDWEPALEWLRFVALRQGRLPADLAPDAGNIEPTWHRTLGEPYLESVRAYLPSNGGEEVSTTIPRSCFQGAAKEATAALAADGRLAANDIVRYLVCALRHPAQSHPPGPEPDRFAVEEIAPPLPIDDRPLASLLDQAETSGDLNKEDMPVFIPRRVLEEAVALTQTAGAAETGGILIGHLHRDASLPEIFAKVTAQVPARHAQQELTTLAFTAETWTSVQAAIALRKKGEIYLGWWHSHPARQWCKDCPEAERQRCQLSGEFFSSHDVALHRAVFPRAYSIALVISDSYANGLTWPLFGWRQGMVKPRGFYVIGPGAPLERSEKKGTVPLV